MQTVDHLIHRSSHSTVIANIPTLGPVAFVLWGYGRDGIALSLAQMILIDFQQCKTVIELFCMIFYDHLHITGANIR